MSRLLEVTDLCSRTVSGTAYRFRHGSTLCSPTIEKILCRSPFRSGHMSAICARLSKGKGRFTRGWKPQVSTLLCARAASAHVPALRRAQLPAEVQRKTSRPLGANTLTQFASPAQPVLKTGCRPEGANTPAAVRAPRSAGAEKNCRPNRGKKPPFVNGISLVFSRPA